MKWPVVLAAVTACAPSGLTLEVVVTDDTERVELFVGDRCGRDCPNNIVVPDIGPRAITDAYLIGDARPWTAERAQFVDGKAGFRLETTEKRPIGILVVVAYNAEGVVTASKTFHGIEVPQSDARLWQVTLEPTQPLAQTVVPQPPGSIGIKLWQGPSMKLASCVLVEHWTDKPEPIRDLIVPKEDTDCDEVAATLECAPWTSNANGAPPTIEAAACVQHQTIGIGSSACVLGGPQCFENGATGAACAPLDEDYCIPETFCACADVPDKTACLRDKLVAGANMASIPILKCSIPLNDSGRPCNADTFAIDAAAYLAANGSRKCLDMRLGELALPLGTIDHSFELAPNNAAYFKLENFTSCRADLVWFGEMPGTSTQQLFGVVDLALDNGKHLAVPLMVEVAPSDCSNSVGTCSFLMPSSAPEETMWNCLASSPTPICMPDFATNCEEGPLCGNICCGKGEYCSPEGCRCGNTGSPCFGGNTCQTGSTEPYVCGTVCCGFDVQCPF